MVNVSAKRYSWSLLSRRQRRLIVVDPSCSGSTRNYRVYVACLKVLVLLGQMPDEKVFLRFWLRSLAGLLDDGVIEDLVASTTCYYASPPLEPRGFLGSVILWGVWSWSCCHVGLIGSNP
jgi:hypothetical protein